METKSIYKIFSVCVFTLMVQLTIMLYPEKQDNKTVDYDNVKSNIEKFVYLDDAAESNEF